MPAPPQPPTQPAPPAPDRSLRDLAQGMMLGGLLTAIVLGLIYVLFARPARPTVVVHPPPTLAPAGAVQPLLPAATLAPTATPGPVTVFVAGAVAQPGVYTLPGGARLQDALDAAGGPSADANLGGVNLALLLHDEEMVRVPAAGEGAAPVEDTSSATRGGGVVLPALTAVVNLNSATQAELESLPGIGPAKAQAIIANRPYASVDDLDRVPGIGPATLAELRPLVTAGQGP